MSITVKETVLTGVYLIEPKVFGDARGYNYESWSKRDMMWSGLFYNWVQDNQSFSAKAGTLRGLHFQEGDYSQAKLVRVVRGSVMDYVVDLRKGSPTYLKWAEFELSTENKLQLVVPRGFAHGFVTLTDDVEFIYKLDNYYAPEHESGIRFDDPLLNIDWNVSEPILSDKDMKLPYLAELIEDNDMLFPYPV